MQPRQAAPPQSPVAASGSPPAHAPPGAACDTAAELDVASEGGSPELAWQPPAAAATKGGAPGRPPAALAPSPAACDPATSAPQPSEPRSRVVPGPAAPAPASGAPAAEATPGDARGPAAQDDAAAAEDARARPPRVQPAASHGAAAGEGAPRRLLCSEPRRLGAGAPWAHRPRRRCRRGPARHRRPVLLLHSPRWHQGPRLRAGRRRGRRRRGCAAPACFRPRAPCRARSQTHVWLPGAGAAEAPFCCACGKAARGPTLACVRCAARCHTACAGAPLAPGARPAAAAAPPVHAGVAARGDMGQCADPSASFTCATCQPAAAPAAPSAAKPKRKRAEQRSAASSGASRRRKAA